MVLCSSAFASSWYRSCNRRYSALDKSVDIKHIVAVMAVAACHICNSLIVAPSIFYGGRARLL